MLFLTRLDGRDEGVKGPRDEAAVLKKDNLHIHFPATVFSISLRKS